MASEFPFISKFKKWRKTQKKIAVITANISLNHFDASFKNSGFTNRRFNRWEDSKRVRQGRGNKTLIDTGRLRRSGSVESAVFRRSVIRFPTVYAARHNEGLNMPKRQFAGKSVALDNKVKKEIEKILTKDLFT